MSSFVYTEAKRAIANKELDLDSDDLRMCLLMTNTTANTEKEKTTIAGFTTLDEFNGSGYSSGGVSVTGRSISSDATNHRANVACSNVVYSAIGAGTRSIAGALLYKFASALGTSIPIAWFDSGGFPLPANGGDLTLAFTVDALLKVG